MFKHIAITSALAGAMLLSTGAVHAVVTELTTNGDFETGDFTGWTNFPNGGTIQIGAGNGGGSAGNAIASGAPIGVTMKQANIGVGLVQPFQDVTISFDWKGTDAAGGVVDVRLFSELDGGGVSDTDILLGGGGFPVDWTTFGPVTVQTGADVSGGITLEMTTICGGAQGCVSNIFWDNVSVTIDVAPVPVPAAVWLFGSGLVGLVGIARRKKAA